MIAPPGSKQKEVLNMLTPTPIGTINPYEAIAAQVKFDRKVKRRRVAEERLRRQLRFSVSYDDETPSEARLRLKTKDHFAFPTVHTSDERFKAACREIVLKTPSPKKRRLLKPIIPTISPNRVDELRETIREAERTIKRAKAELAALVHQEQEETEIESGEETEEEIVLI